MFSQLMADIGFSDTLTADRGMALLTADIGPINKDVWRVNSRH
jgi:hypothetical protein